MNEPPLVSCITVNYRMKNLIRHLLKRVAEARFDFPFEYFLVDNASGDGCPDLVRERYPWVKTVVAPANRGFGAGNNLAIRQASGKYILLFNPDLVVLPGETEKLVAWMEAHPEVGICGPRLLNPDRTVQASRFSFHGLWTPVFRRTVLGRTSWGRRQLARYFMQETPTDQPQEVDWILGAAMLIRRELLDKIGLFDERFFMYFEEEDLCRRAWLGGFKVVYAPVADFLHFYGRGSQTRYALEFFTNRLARIHVLSGLKYLWKYWGQPYPREKKN
jgi:hypothetical protein